MTPEREDEEYALLPLPVRSQGPAEWRSEQEAGNPPPWEFRPFVRLLVRKWLLGFLLLVGLVCQLIVVGVAYELVDLCISLMEVWADLARKHLEITL
jgi:hypothetical protein